jgi:hypothetical protein
MAQKIMLCIERSANVSCGFGVEGKASLNNGMISYSILFLSYETETSKPCTWSKNIKVARPRGF